MDELMKIQEVNPLILQYKPDDTGISLDLILYRPDLLNL